MMLADLDLLPIAEFARHSPGWRAVAAGLLAFERPGALTLHGCASGSANASSRSPPPSRSAAASAAPAQASPPRPRTPAPGRNGPATAAGAVRGSPHLCANASERS